MNESPIPIGLRTLLETHETLSYVCPISCCTGCAGLRMSCAAARRTMPCHAMHHRGVACWLWPMHHVQERMPCRAMRCDAAHERAGWEHTQMRIDLSTEPVTMIFSSYLPPCTHPVRPRPSEWRTAAHCNAHTLQHADRNREYARPARVAKPALVPITREDFVVVC